MKAIGYLTHYLSFLIQVAFILYNPNTYHKGVGP